MRNNKKAIMIYVPISLYSELKNIADEEYWTMTATLMEAIKMYLQKKKKQD